MARFDRLEFEPESEKPRGEGAGPRAEVRDARYWLKQADGERRQGQYENALRLYSRALEMDRSLAAGWVGQVQMLVMLGEHPEAETWARKALELFRNHPELLAGRAQALGRGGDRKPALALCDAALAQPGQSAYRWQVRGELMAAGKQEVDRYCFDKAEGCDADWVVPLETALIYLELRVPSKALPRARRAVEKAAESAYAWCVQGWCEQELGMGERARASLGRCLELQPRHAEAGRRLREVEGGGLSLGRRVRRWLGMS